MEAFSLLVLLYTFQTSSQSRGETAHLIGMNYLFLHRGLETEMLELLTKTAIAATFLSALTMPNSPAQAQIFPLGRLIIPIIINNKQLKPVRDLVKKQVVKSWQKHKHELPKLENLKRHKIGT